MYFTYKSHNKSDDAVKTQFFSIHVNEGSAYRLQDFFHACHVHVMVCTLAEVWLQIRDRAEWVRIRYLAWLSATGETQWICVCVTWSLTYDYSIWSCAPVSHPGCLLWCRVTLPHGCTTLQRLPHHRIWSEYDLTDANLLSWPVGKNNLGGNFTHILPLKQRTSECDNTLQVIYFLLSIFEYLGLALK